MDRPQEAGRLNRSRTELFSIALSKEELERLQLSAAIQRRPWTAQASYYVAKGAEQDVTQYEYEKELRPQGQKVMGEHVHDVPMPFPNAGFPPAPSIPATLTEAQNQGQPERIFTEQSTAPVPSPTPESQNNESPVRLVLYLPSEDWETVNYWAKSAGISPTIMAEKVIRNWSHSSTPSPGRG